MWTPMGPMGVAVNGVPLFNEWARPDGQTDANDEEAFDICCGHPAPGNQYHYHQFPKCVRGSRALGTDIAEDAFPSSASSKKGEDLPVAVAVTTGGGGAVEATAVVVEEQGGCQCAANKEQQHEAAKATTAAPPAVAGGQQEEEAGTGEPVVAATLLELASSDKGHSGLVGYAFDGFPIYGPVGWGADGKPRVMRSSYDQNTKTFTQVRSSREEGREGGREGRQRDGHGWDLADWVINQLD